MDNILNFFHNSIFIFLIISFLVGFLISIFLVLFIPDRFKSHRNEILFFFITIATLLPLVGILFIILFIILLHAISKPTKAHGIKKISYPRFQKSQFKDSKIYGEGGALKTVLDKNINFNERINSLLAVNEKTNQASNRIFQKLLMSSDDELRYYAYTLLHKQQEVISQKIDALNQQLQAETDNELKAQLNKQLAFICWEEIYYFLGSEYDSMIHLENAENYAKEALKVLQSDSSLMLLLAKIELKKYNLTQSKRWLDKSILYNEPYFKTIPFLAELNFRDRKFEEIKNDFSTKTGLNGIINLIPILNFWCKKCQMNTKI